MTIAKLLRQAITEEFQRQGQSGFIVWYDQNGTLKTVVEKACPENAKLLRFEGSYLALRFALEKDDLPFQGQWVIYIPEAPFQESWLRDWELMGTRWEMDLLEILHRKADLPITQKLTELLRLRPQNARDLARSWEEFMDNRPVTEENLVDALLGLAFGLSQWQMDKGLLAFLKGDIGRGQLEDRMLWSLWRERISEWTGWTEIPDDENTLRQKLEAAILLSDLVRVVSELANRFVEVLPSEPKRSAAAELARSWRNHEEFRDEYIRASHRVEQEYKLGDLLMVNETLLNLETFSVIDELWWQELMRAVTSDGSNFGERAQRIGDIAEHRRKLFWARQGQSSYWEPMALATQLYQGCHHAVATLDGTSRSEELVQCYTATEGWWQLDLWALKLAAKEKELTAKERNRFVHPVWQAYRSYLDQVNRSLAKAVQTEGWKPTQTKFWNQVITDQQRTAVFFVDALRYDLARHIGSLLPREEFQLTLNALYGVLPSITEVGMSAVLPEAGEGLEVSAEADLRVRIKGEEVGSREGRKRWLIQRLGQRGKVVELDRIEQVNIDRVKILVVLSREVDEFGTFAANLDPQGILDMISRIAKAMRYLKEQGFERFFVTADHGFLFLPSGITPTAVEAPRAKVCKRRFAVGGSKEGCIVKRSEELGLSGSEIFAFPKGLTVFAIQGETGAFLHGGLSLQECIVPVIEAKAKMLFEKISVVMEVPKRLTSRIAIVKVRVKDSTLLSQSRRVYMEINGKRSGVEELSVGRQEAIIRLSWLDFDETPPQKTTIRLFDADSRQVLEEGTVEVEIVV